MKKIIKVIVIVILLFAIFVCSSVAYEGYSMYKEKTNEISIAKKVEDIKNKEGYIDYEKVPDNFIKAVVAIEDHRFFDHNGIDMISIGRAIITDIKEMALVEGGSTITQQLAKNMYYTQEKKFSRKVAEVFTAFDLEKELSKEEIIELYINISYFGDGYYGIYNASKGYFSKEPLKLSMHEITLLAGLPNAPSAYALSNNTELSVKRQNMVIDAMVKYEYITADEAKDIKKLN